jgi:hypothetical protein
MQKKIVITIEQFDNGIFIGGVAIGSDKHSDEYVYRTHAITQAEVITRCADAINEQANELAICCN